MNFKEHIQTFRLEQSVINRIIEETIKNIDEDYLLIERTNLEIMNFNFASLFVWNKTIEGFIYWNDISNKIPYNYGN